MKERPILFSGAMVRALLSNTKTQTRRVVKPQPDIADWQDAYMMSPKDGRARFRPVAPDWPDGDDDDVYCPYGQPGDRLWVRESWSPDPPDVDGWGYTAWAGCREGQIAGVPERFRHPRFCNYAADWLHGPIRWTPSIHMPRWASRITLEITSVRVERLQDISEADALAEGIVECPIPADDEGPRRIGYMAGPDDGKSGLSVTSIQAYRDLWESINGPDSWAANPWVWALNFRHIDKQGGAA